LPFKLAAPGITIDALAPRLHWILVLGRYVDLVADIILFELS
jgi:hypothetical protein